uniref:Uncharacterized protein n=1 Tax=Rhizophora mucronata TaxID=61149 RepID=A0A2P2QGG3_RHIMU
MLSCCFLGLRSFVYLGILIFFDSSPHSAYQLKANIL